jgi:hypothetical protein
MYPIPVISKTPLFDAFKIKKFRHFKNVPLWDLLIGDETVIG